MFAIHNISCLECDTFQSGNFHSVPYKGIEKLDGCKKIFKYKKSELLFAIGETSQHFFCVSSGEIQLFRTGNQKEHSFAIVGPGAWLGHRDVIAGTPFQHSARCISHECKVCKIDKDVIKDFINKYPSFMSVVMKELAQGWIMTENQSYNLGTRKTAERLADFLLGLIDDNRNTEASNKEEFMEIEFPLTRETVASLIGTTTESVIRTLSDFKGRGWIDFEKGSSIKILKENELRHVLEGS